MLNDLSYDMKNFERNEEILQTFINQYEWALGRIGKSGWSYIISHEDLVEYIEGKPEERKQLYAKFIEQMNNIMLNVYNIANLVQDFDSSEKKISLMLWEGR